MDPLTELSLFTGYAGNTLGLRLAGVPVRTVCYVEWDSYCQQLIVARIKDGILDDGPIWSDVQTFDGRPWRGRVDIVTAGFPCQPHSVAGRRAGESDDRNLWPDTLRVVSEVRPRYVFLENAGIDVRNGGTPAYAYTVLAELAGIGYDTEWASIPAAAVGAPHLRWRWWCLAHTLGPRRRRRRSTATDDVAPGPTGDSGVVCGEIPNAEGQGQQARRVPVRDAETYTGPEHSCDDVSDPTGAGLSDRDARTLRRSTQEQRPERSNWWAVEPEVGRVVDGHPHRVDQIRALGNGVVPACVAKFLRVERS